MASVLVDLPDGTNVQVEMREGKVAAGAFVEGLEGGGREAPDRI